MRAVEMLGVEVTPMTEEELTGTVAEAVRSGSREAPTVVANHNLHSVYLFHREEGMRRFYAAAQCTHIDGMSLVVAGRFLGHDLRRKHRVTYVDWLPRLLQRGAREGWRVFFVGGTREVAEEARSRLLERFPGLQLEVRQGYFDVTPGSEETERVLEAIEAATPDLLLVGLGMPRQERWVADHLGRIRAKVVLNSGAAFDYVAGAVPTPPRWAGRWGLEWVFRFIRQPRHLAYRYLVEPWFVLRLLIAERFRSGRS